jgi:hypothetical protein
MPQRLCGHYDVQETLTLAGNCTMSVQSTTEIYTDRAWKNSFNYRAAITPQITFECPKVYRVQKFVLS